MINYLEGKLKEKVWASFKEHIDNCPGCQRELKVLADTQSRLRQTLKLRAKETFLSSKAEERIRQHLLRQISSPVSPKGPVLKRLFKQKAFSLAAALTVLALVLFFTLFPPPSLEAKIVNLAAQSPQVQNILAQGRIKAGGISVTGKNQGLLFLMVEKREDFQEIQVLVHVDLAKKQVVKIEEHTYPPLTEAEKTKALAIVQNKPEVQELLNQGYAPKEVISAFPPSKKEPAGMNKGLLQLPSGRFARVTLAGKKNKEEIWLVRVNLLTQETVEIIPETKAKETPKEEETKIMWDEERGILKWDGQEGGGMFEIRYGKNSGKS